MFKFLYHLCGLFVGICAIPVFVIFVIIVKSFGGKDVLEHIDFSIK